MTAWNFKDLTGMKFGRLTVIERAEKPCHVKDHQAYWKCHCECGNTKIVCSSSLLKGLTRSCGCLSREKASERRFEDLTGMKFGRLTVIKLAGKDKYGSKLWLCKCDCGNETVVNAGNLKSGLTCSCGCLKRLNLIGMVFNKLKVIGRSENKGSSTYWLCECDCGNKTIVRGSSLKSGAVKSCGCLTKHILHLEGKRFGNLTVIERQGDSSKWVCECDCGRQIIVPQARLLNGGTRSCGCIHASAKQRPEDLRTTYDGIKQRCLNSKSSNFKNYGGRGITMYPEWIDDFQAFYDYVSKLEHFGEEGYTLDRIDVNGNYEPDNLRWADAKTQANNRRNTVFVDYYGEIIPLTEASERSGIAKYILLYRIKRGDTGDRLFRPVKKLSIKKSLR